MTWLAQYFLNPAFVLPGIALASLPIIIHILSRLRYRKVRFAAMEFLLASEELNRRRLILEQLLLLLLRVLAIILITLILARLVLDPSRMLALRGASVHHVIVLDDSLSMRERSEQGTLFAAAVQTLEQLLVQGSNQAGAARITLLVGSTPDRPVVADRKLDTGTLQDILPRIRNLQCSLRSVAISDAMRAAHDILAADAGASPQLHLISDVRTADWVDQPEVQQVLEDLQAMSAGVNIVRVTDQSQPNIAVTALHADSMTATQGVPWRLDVTVHNFSDEQVRDVRGSVSVDGVPLPVNLLLPPLEPRAKLTVSHDLSFDSEGKHEVEVRLADDVLPEDSRRYIAVEVTDRRPVLIVDDEARQQDAAFLAAALAADGNLTGLAADIRTSAVLTQSGLDRYDSICLLNIRDLPADATQALRQYVVAGGGIAWFPDDQANLSWYQETLCDDAIDLFPVPLSSIREVSATDDGKEFLSPIFSSHPIFEIYNLPDSPFASTLLISKWFGVVTESDGADAADSADFRVLCRLPDGDPLILEHQTGQGRILTFLFGAGRRWSNWPVAPAAPGYVVTQLLLQQYLQREPTSLQSRELNELLAMRWPVDEYGSEVEIFLPDESAPAAAGEESFLRLQAAPVIFDAETGRFVAQQQNESAPPDDRSADQFFEVRVPQADRAGVYRIRRFDGQGDPQETWIALNIAPGESDLTAAAAPQLAPLTSIKGVRLLDAAGADTLGSGDAGRELRWTLLLITIAVLIAEQLLSLKMSYHPEVRG